MMELITHLNFRDLGGLPVGQGVIASGKLFRSEGPRNFTPKQIEELQAFQIRTIIDPVSYTHLTLPTIYSV